MYIMITTRCNMQCDHCGFSCTEKGIDMTVSTFKKALKIAEEFGECISIGGGEPTIHPKFWEFIGLSLGSDVEGIWMATNGKKTETIRRLVRLAYGSEVFSVSLSQDGFHEPIDDHIVNIFNKKGKRYEENTPNINTRELNDNKILPYGRGKDLLNNFPKWYKKAKGCICDELFVYPTGEIFRCGCMTNSLGTVSKPKITEKIREKANEIGWCINHNNVFPKRTLKEEIEEYEPC